MKSKTEIVLEMLIIPTNILPVRILNYLQHIDTVMMYIVRNNYLKQLL